MSKEQNGYNWISKWITNRKDIFGYPDSLIEARTAKAYEFALQNINVTGKTVLDYGSGYGHGTLKIALEKPKQLMGTSLHRGALKKQQNLFQNRINNLTYIQTKNSLPFNNKSFDVVFLNHVIEHINPQLVTPFIEQLNQIIKSSGIVCVVTPNANEVIKPLTEGRKYEPGWQHT